MIEIQLKVFKADLIITLLFRMQTAYVVYGAFPCLSIDYTFFNYKILMKNQNQSRHYNILNGN